ncbi:MAG: methytransferase partner Trm112 [Methanomicrobiales archaeon]
MKRSLLDILCCPVCKGDLGLEVQNEDEAGIIEGTLTCARCSVAYPINDGIPDLLPRTESHH